MSQSSKDHHPVMDGIPMIPPEMHNQELIRKIVREELQKIFNDVPKLQESKLIYESIEDMRQGCAVGEQIIPGASTCNELLQSIRDAISNQESES